MSPVGIMTIPLIAGVFLIPIISGIHLISEWWLVATLVCAYLYGISYAGERVALGGDFRNMRPDEFRMASRVVRNAAILWSAIGLVVFLISRGLAWLLLRFL
jgi:hypothetical protein